MKEIYSWVPWFRELAEKIAKEGEDYLNQKAKGVDWGRNLKSLEFGDRGIDPFSFIYFLASKAATNQLKTVYDSVSQEFAIGSPLPDSTKYEYYIFPTPEPRFSGFYVKTDSGHELLWELFIEAREGKISAENFENALKLNGVGVFNLTQTLFLINPKHYQPADNLTDELSEALELRPLAELEREIKKAGGYEEYLTFLKKLKDAFQGCEHYEVNMFLFLRRTEQISVSDRFYHVSTQVHGHNKGDFWNNPDDNYRNYNFKQNNWVYTGGPGSGKRWGEEGDYPLTEPASGEIVLVRTGLRRGRAIGIVQKNDYAEKGINENSRIHVLWINREEEQLSRDTRQNAFEKIEPGWNTYAAFRETDAYRRSFDLIESLSGNLTANERQSQPDEQQPGTEITDNRHPLNQILYGPPGTSKTWHTVNHALAIIDNEPVDPLEMESKEEREKKTAQFNKMKADGRIEMVTFHQNYNYEDFIEGIKPVLREDADDDGNLDYLMSQGVFRRIAESARIDSKRKYVLIIDEINRGNIAKIFGELITLIEDSKRTGGNDPATVTLPYSKEEFGVPDNLYIIGTMNTADRSIALLDTALRRRFHFVEMMPDPKLVPEDIQGVNCQKLLEAMNNRIRFLLDREHQIGHTYLMNVKSIDSLASTFKNKIVPLLQEYFYDNWEKIELVLKCNGFVKKREIPEELQAEDQLIDVEQKVYDVLPDGDDRWRDPESYRAIYEQAKSGSEQGS